MATIDRIRKRSGLLIVIVFVALMSFVLGDLFRSGGSKFFGDPNVVGTINGRDITRLELTEGIEELKIANPQYQEMTSVQLANIVWNNILIQEVLATEMGDAGLEVSKEELFLDIINNPNIRSAFVGQDGRFDDNLVRNYISQIRDNKDVSAQSQEMWTQWLAFENAVIEQGKTFKYTSALEKGIHMPAALVAQDLNYENTQVPAQYVYVPYIDVNEDEIEVTEADAKKYYNAHKDEFEQEEVRNIEYINFPLMPSMKDREDVRAELAKLALEWISIEDDSVFTNLNSEERFNPTYFTVDELIGTGIDTLVDGQEVGYIKGPIERQNSFTVIKIAGKKTLADSVEARHILIPFAGATRVDPSVVRTPQEAKVLADSLFAYVKENPAAFESVSDEFSSDVVAKGKGGSLGYFSRGMMARPFENFCFYGKTGEMGLVFTEFGFHIIEITDQKGANDAYQIAEIVRNVVPSEATIQDLYTQASSYASDAQTADDYRALAASRSLFLRPAQNLGHFEEVIPGLGNSRRIVRWAWDEEREEGNIGLIENDGAGYVVVILTDILEAGTTPFEKVLEVCMEGAKKEAKKAVIEDQLNGALANNSNIDDVAKALDKKVRTMNFTAKKASIPGVGSEPKVVGAICGLSANEMSQVLLGENGAFVAVAGEKTVKNLADGVAENEAKSVERSLRNLVGTQAVKALQDKAKVEDKRHLMF